jgi:hypothetical protein
MGRIVASATLSKELKDSVCEFVQNQVAEEFEEPDDIVESTVEVFADEAEEDVLRPIAEPLTAAAIGRSFAPRNPDRPFQGGDDNEDDPPKWPIFVRSVAAAFFTPLLRSSSSKAVTRSSTVASVGPSRSA